MGATQWWRPKGQQTKGSGHAKVAAVGQAGRRAGPKGRAMQWWQPKGGHAEGPCHAMVAADGQGDRWVGPKGLATQQWRPMGKHAKGTGRRAMLPSGPKGQAEGPRTPSRRAMPMGLAPQRGLLPAEEPCGTRRCRPKGQPKGFRNVQDTNVSAEGPAEGSIAFGKL